MKVLSALCLLLASVCLISAQNNRCGANEIWKECGTACPATCERQGPRICTFNCVSQCECADGFVRRATGDLCIRPVDCEQFKRFRRSIYQ